MMDIILVQLKRLLVHWVNIVSNIVFGDDFFGMLGRRIALSIIGNTFGKNTKVRGGSYFGWGGLSVGESCFLNRNLYLDTTSKIIVGNNVTIGHGVTLVTAHHIIGEAHCRAGNVIPKPIHVETGAWIGANAVILPGIRIGAGAVVAAGAVVVKDVDANTLVGGVPAKQIRLLDDGEEN